MASEQEKAFEHYRNSIEDPKAIPIDAIHIDLKENSFRLLAADMTVAILTFQSPALRLYLETLPSHLMNLFADDIAESELQPSTLVEELKAANAPSTIVLAGKIKGAVKPGKLDRSGRPTAWSKFAAHWREEREARMLLATYHGWTAEVALSLQPDSSITAQGYYHQPNQPNRLGSFSVIALHQWPGKPEEPTDVQRSTPTGSHRQFRLPRK